MISTQNERNMFIMKVITKAKVDIERTWEAWISLLVLFNGLFLGLQSSFFVWQTDPSQVVQNQLPDDFTWDDFPIPTK